MVITSRARYRDSAGSSFSDGILEDLARVADGGIGDLQERVPDMLMMLWW
jgi:hypothetical protein